MAGIWIRHTSSHFAPTTMPERIKRWHSDGTCEKHIEVIIGAQWALLPRCMAHQHTCNFLRRSHSPGKRPGEARGGVPHQPAKTPKPSLPKGDDMTEPGSNS